MEKHAYNVGVRHALDTLGLWKVAQGVPNLGGATAPPPQGKGQIIRGPALNTAPTKPAPNVPLRQRLPTVPPAPQQAR